MALPTRIVTSHFEYSNGAPVANEQFSFRRAPWSYQAGSVVLADSIPDITDANGDAATLLWTNAEGMRPSRYTVMFPNGEQSRMFVLPAGSTPISLDELFALALEWGVPDIEDLFDARDAAIYGALANTADPLLGDNLVGSTLTNDGIQRTVHAVLDEFDDQMDTHAALESDSDTPGHVDLTTIQSMIDVTHSSIASSSTWIWRAAPSTIDPGSNTAGMNIDDWASATVLWLNRLGAGGTNYAGMLASLRSGDAIYIQQIDNVAAWQRLQVTGAPTTNASAYGIPITHLGNGPGGEPADGSTLFVSFSPSVSGSGIPPVGGEVPDNSVSSIKIIDGSIVATDLAANSVTGPKIVSNAIAPGVNFMFDPINDRGAPPGFNAKGRLRYHHPEQMSLVAGANKYGSGVLLRFHYLATNTQGGKYSYTDEGRVIAGDAIQLAAEASGTIGEKYKLNVKVFDSAGGTVIDTVSTADITCDGTVQLWSIPALTMLANGYSILLWFSRTLGTNPIDIHAMSVAKGTFIPVSQGPELAELYVATQPQSTNLIDFPYNEKWRDFPSHYNGLARWQTPQNAVMVPDDPANPFHGTTFRSPTGLQAGIKLHRSEKYIRDNEYLTIAVLMGSASIPALPTDNMGGTLKARCIQADDATIAGDGLIVTSNIVYFPVTQAIAILSILIPPDCAIIWIWVSRSGIGAPAVDVYEWWAVPGLLGGLRATPGPSALVTQNALLSDSLFSRMGEHNLQNWRGLLARMNAQAHPGWHNRTWTDNSVVQASIALTGDSWNARKNHYGALRDRMQARYGNGGPGWMSATVNGQTSSAYGWQQFKTGVFTNVDANAGAGVTDYTALGIELTHDLTMDLSATIVWNMVGTTADRIEIHFCKMPGGGTFQVQIDALGYSADIPTANATRIPAKHVISGLADAAHLISIRFTAIGTAGVIIHSAVALRTSINAVVLHKLGNGSSTSRDYVLPAGGVVGVDGIDLEYYKAQLILLNPTLLLHIISTNDRTQNDSAPAGRFTPLMARTNTEAFFDTCRAALPLLDLFMVSSADTGSGLVPMELYDQNLMVGAYNKRAAYLSGRLIMSPNSANIARNLMGPISGPNGPVTDDLADNSRHLSDIGCDLFAAEEEKMLML